MNKRPSLTPNAVIRRSRLAIKGEAVPALAYDQHDPHYPDRRLEPPHHEPTIPEPPLNPDLSEEPSLQAVDDRVRRIEDLASTLFARKSKTAATEDIHRFVESLVETGALDDSILRDGLISFMSLIPVEATVDYRIDDETESVPAYQWFKEVFSALLLTRGPRHCSGPEEEESDEGCSFGPSQYRMCLRARALQVETGISFVEAVTAVSSDKGNRVKE